MTENLLNTEKRFTPFTLDFSHLTARNMTFYVLSEKFLRTPLTFNLLKRTLFDMLLKISSTDLFLTVFSRTFKNFLWTFYLMLSLIFIKKALFAVETFVWFFWTIFRVNIDLPSHKFLVTVSAKLRDFWAMLS